MDPPLDEVGRAQAFEVAAMIATLRPALVVASDAQRAVQTANPVAEAAGVELVVDGRLRERSLGHWEGLTRDEVAVRYPDEFADWVAGRDVSRRGGESRPEVARRATAAFADLPLEETVVVVTHSATALALCSSVLGLPIADPVLAPLANCHWSELLVETHEHEAGHWRLRAHNVGAPGAVVPVPVAATDPEEPTDADA